MSGGVARTGGVRKSLGAGIPTSWLDVPPTAPPPLPPPRLQPPPSSAAPLPPVLPVPSPGVPPPTDMSRSCAPPVERAQATSASAVITNIHFIGWSDERPR